MSTLALKLANTLDLILALLLGASSPSASQSSLTPDTASVVTANGSSTIAYTGVLRDDSGNEMAGVTGVTVEAVEWFALSRILADSFVSVSSPFIASDGVEAVTISVQLGGYRNGEFYPLVGVAAADIAVAVSGSNNTIAPLSGVTDENGIIETTFTTTQAATVKTISATLFGDALTDTATCESDGTPGAGGLFLDNPFTGSTTLSDHNENGFVWAALNDTALVDTGGGNIKLRFRYTPTAQAQQNFTLGRDCSELWIEYDWTIPANFVHTTTPPTNNKFMMLWKTVYGSLSLTWQVGYEFQLVGGVSCIRPMSSQETGDLGRYVTSSGLGHPNHNKEFIGGSGPCSPGNTYQIRHHVKMASADGVADGVMEMWVDGVLFAAMYDGEFRNHTTSADHGTDPVLKQGYFMGAANAVYGEQTDFYIDNVKFYDEDPAW